MSDEVPSEVAAPAPAETKPEGGSEPITVRVRDQVSGIKLRRMSHLLWQSCG